jgi:hypothetical protein|nr:MAG TPA: hypothetical protein [Caudoviricetes sp.]
MYTKTQLKSMVNSGLMNDVYKDCRRYGEIREIIDYEYTHTINFKTNEKRTDFITVVIIEYKNLLWTFELVKGECIEIEYKAA